MVVTGLKSVKCESKRDFDSIVGLISSIKSN